MDKSTFTSWPANANPVGNHLLVVDVADAVQDHFEEQSRKKLNSLIGKLAATTSPSAELKKNRDKAIGLKRSRKPAALLRFSIAIRAKESTV